MAGKKFERPLPSQHEKERELLDKATQERDDEIQRKQTRLLQAFDWVAKQEQGRLVLGWLFERCGYNKPVLMRVVGGDIAPMSTECAAAQREVYRDVRKLLRPEVLAAVFQRKLSLLASAARRRVVNSGESNANSTAPEATR